MLILLQTQTVKASALSNQDLIDQSTWLNWPAAVLLLLIVVIVFLIFKVRDNDKTLDKLRTELEHLSRTDDLTQLYNRRYLDKRLYEEFELHIRNKSSNSVLLMIELDDFQSVIDDYGQAAGDLVIQTEANLVYDRVRNTDLCGRYGDVAFLVLLRNTTAEPARILADEVCKKIKATQIQYSQQEFNVSCSIGLSAYSADMDSCRDWIQQADQDLYRAKQKHTNHIPPAE